MAVARRTQVLVAFGTFTITWIYIFMIWSDKSHLKSATFNCQGRLTRKELETKEKEISQLRDRLTSLGFTQYDSKLPIIYVITPTYYRLVQKAELTRLATVLRSVANIHWIIIEDAREKSPLVTRLLSNSGLNFTHLVKTSPPHFNRSKGVLQRNAGLAWLRDNVKGSSGEGVVYFADDDNTYTTDVFSEVVDWRTGYQRRQRKFALDMAGFAVNLNLLFDKQTANFNLSSKSGYQETDFLQQLNVTLNDLEPKADMCTKVLVWHTRTSKPSVKAEEKVMKTDLANLTIDMEV